MHYTLRDGAQLTWRDRVKAVGTHLRNHNWLPMAVGTIVVAWLSLLISGITQEGPPGVPAPATYADSKNASSQLAVDQQGSTAPSPSTQTANSGNRKATSPSSAATATVQPAAITPTQTTTTQSAENIIGGRGADVTTSPTTTDTSTPASNTGGTSGIGVGITLPGILDVDAGIGGDKPLNLNLDLL